MAPRNKGKDKVKGDGPLKEKDMKELMELIKSFKKPSKERGFGGVFFFKDRDLAVKKIKPQDLIQYENEVEKLTKLKSHPNIIRMLGSFQAEGKAQFGYLFLEMCQESLLEAIQSKEMKLDDIVSVAVGTARGLQHIHESGIAHCDLKPENILLTKNKEVKLIDFGGAVAFKETLIVQTEGYFPRGETKVATPQLDVYAYGTVVLQLLRCSVELSVRGRKGEIMSLQEYCLAREDGQVSHGRFNAEKDKKKLESLARLAKSCVHEKPHTRPRLEEVLHTLESL